MKTGTKSILVGVHQFILHPLTVAVAWWRLYGFPTDIRLWVAFFVHDLGYWGKAKMDDEDGERHVEFGANFMLTFFGPVWGDFCRYHSRFYAKREGQPVSRLCVADKYALVITPWWVYLPLAWMSGELWEYNALRSGSGKDSKYQGEPNSEYVTAKLNEGTIRAWHEGLVAYVADWVEEHKDGKEDAWTPAAPGWSQTLDKPYQSITSQLRYSIARDLARETDEAMLWSDKIKAPPRIQLIRTKDLIAHPANPRKTKETGLDSFGDVMEALGELYEAWPWGAKEEADLTPDLASTVERMLKAYDDWLD